MIQRRKTGEPLQYILGSVTFLGLPLSTRHPILIPRPETELMIGWTLARWKNRDYRKTRAHMSITQEGKYEDIIPWCKMKEQSNRSVSSFIASQFRPEPSSGSSSPTLRILDLCSGSGNIALSLHHHMPHRSHIVGCDIHPTAIELSQQNMASLNRLYPDHPLGSTCQFHSIDLLEADPTSPLLFELPSSFGSVRNPLVDSLLNPPDFISRLGLLTPSMNRVNLIVSNPPYIPINELADLQTEVRDWESPTALVSGDDGMQLLKHIIRAAPTLLYSKQSQTMLEWKPSQSSSSSLPSSDTTLIDTSDWDVPEIVLEIGSAGQAMELADFLQSLDFHHLTIHHDMAGLPRWIAAARKKNVAN